MMPYCGILVLLFSLHSPFAAESTIYAADIANFTIREQRLHSSIIDYCLDEFLYVLTKRYLYKIDPDDLRITDRTLLPQTYTSLCTNATKVLLISAGEIVILSKSHLAYESGIGITYGDLYPLISPQGRTIAPDETSLYVLVDEGSESLLKIIDLNTGNVRKARKTEKILEYRYNVLAHTLTALDAQQRLVTYDLSLNKTNSTRLPMAVEWFLSNNTGFYVGTHAGLYMLAQDGSLIDVQPLMALTAQSYEDFIFINDQNMVYLDSLTLRPREVVPNSRHITHFFSVDHPLYVIGMDDAERFYFIHLPTLDIHPRVTYESIALDISPVTVPVTRDSLWYMQLGAFSNKTNAFNLYVELRARKIPAFIDSAEVYRVKLGGFFDKQVGIYVADHLNLNGWFSLQPKVENSEHTDFIIELEHLILKDGIITRSGYEENSRN